MNIKIYFILKIYCELNRNMFLNFFHLNVFKKKILTFNDCKTYKTLKKVLKLILCFMQYKITPVVI